MLCRATKWSARQLLICGFSLGAVQYHGRPERRGRNGRARVPGASRSVVQCRVSHVCLFLRSLENVWCRYKEIVSGIEAGGGSAPELSSALGPLLDELDAKGKQLNLLKQVYDQAASSNIDPIRHRVHSPDAIRRKTASLRLLSDYRQLERDARSSPRHGQQDYL